MPRDHQPAVIAAFSRAGIDLAAADERAITPLQAAAVAGHLDLARDLLAYGVRLDAFSAASLGDVPALRRLVDRGKAPLNTVLPEPKATLLALAIRHGQADALRLLLELGADPRGPDPMDLEPPQRRASPARPRVASLADCSRRRG